MYHKDNYFLEREFVILGKRGLEFGMATGKGAEK